MPAWPGGPCPDCGDDMPARVLRCRTCGAVLNPDLTPRPIEAAEFIELPEVRVVREVTPAGFYIGCPNCERELKVAAKYLGEQVQCRFCTAPFRFVRHDPLIRRIAAYADCPHCHQQLRMAEKYLGRNVACKNCSGAIKIRAVD